MTLASSVKPIFSAETALAALGEDDQQIRYYATWWLGKHQVQSAGISLCELLKDEDYRTVQGGYPLRRQAARALGQLKQVETVPALIMALDCQEDLQLREAVIQALAAIGDRHAIVPLLRLLHSEKPQPYEALIEALGEFQVSEAWSDVVPFLEHSSERIQCAAARYCYQISQEKRYLTRIIDNLNHENSYVRWAAVFDLGAIGHLAAAEAILEAQIANSLKLLNLKRILESVLKSDRPDEEKQMASETLFEAIDELLWQL
ncbi:MAG: bilin biosynthesis protein PecE [Phormidium sp. OSCR]|nr:MAG: bilin biosynthesis protein PecE [Phormidium sp. OSCR]